jgi:gamma-glutamyltranspeptidase
MLAKMRAVCLILIFVGGIVSIADAGQQIGETVDMQKMQQQLLELQKQMELMKAQYNAEIQSLKEQLQKAGQTGTVTEKETPQSELDALLARMQEEAGKEEKEKTPEETVFRFKGLGLQALSPSSTRKT